MTSTLAWATPPAPEALSESQLKAEKAVRTALVQPLAAKEQERSRFSRARMPAVTRRVRVLDAAPKKDGQGQAFQTFAVDARHGWGKLEDFEDDAPEARADKAEKAWRKDAIVGCVYDSGEVYVKKGEEYRPAAVLLGKKTKAADKHICVAATGELAQR